MSYIGGILGLRPERVGGIPIQKRTCIYIRRPKMRTSVLSGVAYCIHLIICKYSLLLM